MDVSLEKEVPIKFWNSSIPHLCVCYQYYIITTDQSFVKILPEIGLGDGSKVLNFGRSRSKIKVTVRSTEYLKKLWVNFDEILCANIYWAEEQYVLQG